MTIHIALLRGINVGGNNKIKMADLREGLGELGLAKVQTYIQSGNILFESSEDEAILRQRIEQLIQDKFGLSIKVIIRTAEELKKIAANCPFSEQQIAEADASSEAVSLYVSMLLDELQAERIEKLKALDLKDDLYQVAGREIYLLYRQGVRNSKLSVHMEKLGVPSTVRNWNTLNKLVALATEMEDSKAIL